MQRLRVVPGPGSPSDPAGWGRRWQRVVTEPRLVHPRTRKFKVSATGLPGLGPAPRSQWQPMSSLSFPIPSSLLPLPLR